MELKIYCDGGARGNPGPAAGAFVVLADNKEIAAEGKSFRVATNNEAEYGAVIMAMTWLLKNNAASVVFYLDSELVVKQLNGVYKIKSKKLLPLAAKIKKLERDFSGKIKFENVRRGKNKRADQLVNQTLDKPRVT